MINTETLDSVAWATISGVVILPSWFSIIHFPLSFGGIFTILYWFIKKLIITSMYFLIKSVLTFTDPGSILVDDRMLESQKHWMACKSMDFEEGLGVWGICFGGSGGLGFSFGGLWRLGAVFFVTISYLFPSFILSNSIVSATFRDDICVSMVTCFISRVLVIIRVFSAMPFNFIFSYFYSIEKQQNKYNPILWQIIPDRFWLIQFISLSDIPSSIIQNYPFLFHFSITLNYIFMLSIKLFT